MVNKERVFTLEGGSVGDGASEQLTESDNESWMIEKIQVREESGTSLDGSAATISIAGTSVTEQNVIIDSLQAEYSEIPPMDLEWPEQKQFEFDWTNSSGSSATVNVMLWVKPLNETQA